MKGEFERILNELFLFKWKTEDLAKEDVVKDKDLETTLAPLVLGTKGGCRIILHKKVKQLFFLSTQNWSITLKG